MSKSFICKRIFMPCNLFQKLNSMPKIFLRNFSFKFDRQKLQHSRFVSERICKICSSGTISRRDVRNFPRARNSFQEKEWISFAFFHNEMIFEYRTYVNEIYKFRYSMYISNKYINPIYSCSSCLKIVCFQQSLTFFLAAVSLTIRR